MKTHPPIRIDYWIAALLPVFHREDPELTQITCTPVALATHRLYVIAEPVEGG